MAARRNKSRDFRENDSSDDESRELEDTTVAVRPTNGRDMATTQQSGQLQENSSGGADNQLATGSSVNVVGNKGPTMLGENSAVYNNCTILQGQHVHHHHHHCPRHSKHHDNSSFYHVPCHCDKCIDYHDNDHQPLAEHHHPPPGPDPRQLGLPSVPQLLPPTSQQAGHVESTEIRTSGEYSQNAHSHLKQNIQGQSSSNSPRSPPSDVTNHVAQTHPREQTQQKGREQTTAASAVDLVADKTQKSHPTREDTNRRLKEKFRGEQLLHSPRPPPSDVTNHVTQAQSEERREEKAAINGNLTDRKSEKSHFTPEVPKSAERRQVDDASYTVKILDSRGQQLQPGDIVSVDKHYYEVYQIYVGDMDVVWCERRGDQVEKEKLTMTEPFYKVTITRGSCVIFPPRERVARAESWVGKTFKVEGGWLWFGGGRDFLAWVCTGRAYGQVGDQTAGTMSTCRTHIQQHCLL